MDEAAVFKKNTFSLSDSIPLSRCFVVLLLLFALQLPSLAPIEKYAHVNMFLVSPLYMLCVGFFYYYLLKSTNTNRLVWVFLNSPYTLAVLIAALCCVFWFYILMK